jgi:trehalose synthase
MQKADVPSTHLARNLHECKKELAMIPTIEDYEQFVGRQNIESIKSVAEKLEGKHVVHVNSTYSGGGVAELLNSLVVLKNKLGIETDWRLLKGSHSFFNITKKFHNALQGEPLRLSQAEKSLYLEELERNALMHHFHEHDLVFIHDPQPLALMKYVKRKRQPWIWRCHVEITNASKDVWSFLRPFASKYDGAIFSMNIYRRKDLKIPQFFIAPSIDPLSLKNAELSTRKCRSIIEEEGIPLSKPIITQVSRFDKWKNPLGVVHIFNHVKEREDATLVLIGDMASDDPEGPLIYNKVMQHAEHRRDIHIITQKDDVLVNALQKMSAVVLQNSIREGFGLTVAEAMWKETPVIGTNVGGIPLQIIHGKTGALISNSQEAADWCVKLMRNERLRSRMGIEAKEHVRRNFLVTRQLQDYLNVIDSYTNTVVDNVMKAAKNLRKLLLKPVYH